MVLLLLLLLGCLEVLVRQTCLLLVMVMMVMVCRMLLLLLLGRLHRMRTLLDDRQRLVRRLARLSDVAHRASGPTTLLWFPLSRLYALLLHSHGPVHLFELSCDDVILAAFVRLFC